MSRLPGYERPLFAVVVDCNITDVANGAHSRRREKLCRRHASYINLDSSFQSLGYHIGAGGIEIDQDTPILSSHAGSKSALHPCRQLTIVLGGMSVLDA